MSTLLESLSHTVERTLSPLRSTLPQAVAEQAGIPPPPPNPARTVQQVAGGLLGVLSLPVELLNTGFAVATNAIAQALPSFPAATMTSLYVGPPHGHLHPPSFTPPATPVPVPLPSLGPVLLGTSIQVLINGMPAARAGDLGFALTCCGFFPVFEVFTGSSKVFIGGMRAARMGDMCRACQPSLAGPVRGIAAAMRAAGTAVALAGVAADMADAGNATDPSMASALAMSAGMGAAQAAADVAALALSAAMGKDMAVPPAMGALLVGHPNVLIGGFPMINFPDPAALLLSKLKGLRGRKRRQSTETAEVGSTSCPR